MNKDTSNLSNKKECTRTMDDQKETENKHQWIGNPIERMGKEVGTQFDIYSKKKDHMEKFHIDRITEKKYRYLAIFGIIYFSNCLENILKRKAWM